jgi:hypothetical protein
MSESEHESVQLRIKFPVNPGQAVFVNNVTLQRDVSGNVYISFFQILPPIVIAESSEDIKMEVESLGTVDAIPVARIVMSPKDAVSILSLFKRNLERVNEPASSIT